MLIGCLIHIGCAVGSGRLACVLCACIISTLYSTCYIEKEESPSGSYMFFFFIRCLVCLLVCVMFMTDISKFNPDQCIFPLIYIIHTFFKIAFHSTQFMAYHFEIGVVKPHSHTPNTHKKKTEERERKIRRWTSFFAWSIENKHTN